MFSCLVFLDQLTMLRPLPEHLHLELVVMVMRGGDLQPQVSKGDGAQRGFRVRERGGKREVRGRRRERRERKRRRKGGWRWRGRRGELIGEIITFGRVWSSQVERTEKRRRKITQRKTLLLCVSKLFSLWIAYWPCACFVYTDLLHSTGNLHCGIIINW